MNGPLPFTPNPLDMTGKVALIALVLACGAEDNEVNAVFERLAHKEMPEDREQIVAQVRATIAEVRGG